MIKHRINDDFKNPKGILFDYLNNEKVIINDFIKIQTILKDIRHSIAHFNFDFIKKLFNNEQTFDFEIELLDILFKQKEKNIMKLKQIISKMKQLKYLMKKNFYLKNYTVFILKYVKRNQLLTNL